MTTGSVVRPIIAFEDELLSTTGLNFQKHSIAQSALSARGYAIVRAIGTGAYAGVFLVHSVRYDTDFVAKVSVHDGHESVDQNTEISVLKTMIHPHILAIYDSFSDKKFLYIVLEYCKGGSLLTLVRGQGALPPMRLCTTCYQIAQALQELHRRNIAHQDIKPGNVLLDSHMRPKLADFGLSQIFDDGKGITSTRVGSLAYMAPEVIKGDVRDPFLSDVWALGVTFFFAAAGFMPWQADTSMELERIIRSGVFPTLQGVASAFRTMVAKMLTVDPRNRPPIDWAVDQLRAIVADTAGDEPMESERGPVQRRRRPSNLAWGKGILLQSPGRRSNLTSSFRRQTFTEEE